MADHSTLRDEIAIAIYCGAWAGLAYAFWRLFRQPGWWEALLLIPAWWLIRAPGWYTGWFGLNQFPNPHGRYYNEWLRLPEGAGDYYPWLARKMGNREPWRTWVKLERAMEIVADEDDDG